MALIINIKFYLILIVFFNFYYSQIDTSDTTITENKEPNYIPAYDFISANIVYDLNGWYRY